MSPKSLDCLFDQFDIGVGCLALYRRNADIDTTLKIIECACRGLPVVTSGKMPISNNNVEKIIIHVENNNNAIDVADLLRQYHNISIEDKLKAQEEAVRIYNWDIIAKKSLF